MRMITKALMAVLAGAFISATSASAAPAWNCKEAANVCAKKMHAAKSTPHHAKSHKAKSHKAKHHAGKAKRHAKSSYKKSRKVSYKSNSGARSSGSSGGIASWYGGKFHGRKTASGERYNQNALTAAHRSLPFGTRVRVTNASNGNAVVVRINDRGPFIRGRVIDLSRAAANQIGINGLGRVTLTVLGRG